MPDAGGGWKAPRALPSRRVAVLSGGGLLFAGVLTLSLVTEGFDDLTFLYVLPITIVAGAPLTAGHRVRSSRGSGADRSRGGKADERRPRDHQLRESLPPPRRDLPHPPVGRHFDPRARIDPREREGRHRAQAGGRAAA